MQKFYMIRIVRRLRTQRYVVRKSGYSVIEILIAVTVLIMVSGIVLASFNRFRRRAVVQNAAGSVASLLREARALTLAARDGVAWGVHFEATEVTLFKGPTFIAGAADNKLSRLDTLVRLATTSITGGGSTILFKKISGETDNSATTTISLVSDSTVSRTVTVSASGIIELQ